MLRTGSETTFPRLQGVWASTLESSVCLGSLAIMTSTEEQKKAILPFLQVRRTLCLTVLRMQQYSECATVL